MLNLFHKLRIENILKSKIENNEIIKYKLSDNNLCLYISRKKLYNIDLNKVSGKELVNILWKKIPKDIDSHFKIEIRNIKLNNLLK